MRVNLFDRMDAAQQADALAGMHSCDIAPLLQSIIDEYVPRGGCAIELQCKSRLDSEVIVGDRIGGTFTSFSFVGDGYLNSQFISNTPGTMLKYWRNKYASMSGLGIINGAAMGSAIGMHLTGPAAGTQSNGLSFENIEVQGFKVGVQAGGGPLGTECASELTFNHVGFTFNERGFLGAGSGNTIDIRFRDVGLNQNTMYGVDCGSAQWVNFDSGGSHGNGIAAIKLQSAWQAEFTAKKMRFELGPTEYAVMLAQGRSAAIEDCGFLATSGVAPVKPVIFGFPNALMLTRNIFGSAASPGWLTCGEGLAQAKNYALIAEGNTIYGDKLFWINPANTEAAGLRYYERGNTYGSPMALQPERHGFVNWPNRVDN